MAKPNPDTSAPHAVWQESTRLLHAGDSSATRLGTQARIVNPPIQRASTVLMPNAASLYSADQPSYGRQGLGVQAALESALCELEEADAVTLFSSGAGAVTGALMAVLSSGDELLAADGVYRPTRRLCGGTLKRFGISTRYYPARATPEEILAMAGPQTRAILLESPASLTFEMQDTPAIAAAARARGLITLIDNTWAAGALFKPLAAGVDVSIQALTKYVSGASDVFMGSVATSDPRWSQALKAFALETGWAVSPDDCYTLLRGLRTLPLRLQRHGESALQIARWLETQPEVTSVLCPALSSSPDHALWRRDYSGLCGLFGVMLQPAPPPAVEAFLDRLTLFGLGFSWGGYESLAIHCDPQVQRTARPWLGLGPLIRLHIGLEAPGDLIADLRQGLDVFAAACEGDV
jgi:cystathionine beta-lyase